VNSYKIRDPGLIRNVLGIDLACRSWRDIGSASLTFRTGGESRWIDVAPGCLSWPNLELTPQNLAEAINYYAQNHNISAVSLDGPQGWRDPSAGLRKGVGRWCEYETKTPAKTGTFGVTYPGTWRRWIEFSVDVFSDLLGLGHVLLANDPITLPSIPEQGYLLLECFPTSTWKASGLRPLPGHSNANRNVVVEWARRIQICYGLPRNAATENHDDLQAIVGALPAAALLNGPCVAAPKGEPAKLVTSGNGNPSHRVEGLIWDAMP